jgi:hypothetical protein
MVRLYAVVVVRLSAQLTANHREFIPGQGCFCFFGIMPKQGGKVE